MSHYVDGGESPVTFPPGPVVCDPKQATAWDVIDKACYTIWGVGVTIDNTTSVQAGFEVFNYNMHRDGTQTCCVNCYQLPGVFV